MATKSAKKSQSISWTTPWFTARYPKISKPDTEGKFADGKFKTDGILDEDDVEAVRKVLVDAGKQFWPEVAEEDLKLPLREFTDKNKDTGTETSAGWGITLKSKYKPAVFDCGKPRKKLPDSVAIGGGSVIRVATQIQPWSKEEEQTIVEKGKKRKEKVTVYGLLLRLNDTQVKELKQYSASGDGSAFGDDEVDGGFEYGGKADEGGDAFDDDAADL